MDDATPEDGQHPNEDLLTTLPNEILILITELLPAREICRLRAQNRHLRSFVNTNQRLLVKSVINHHRNRIHAEHKSLTDLADCDTFDSFQRYYSHYGDITTPMESLKTRATSLTLRNELNKSRAGHSIPTAALPFVFSQQFLSTTQEQRVSNCLLMHRFATGELTRFHSVGPGGVSQKTRVRTCC
jgi:hypothetical protein